MHSLKFDIVILFICIGSVWSLIPIVPVEISLDGPPAQLPIQGPAMPVKPAPVQIAPIAIRPLPIIIRPPIRPPILPPIRIFTLRPLATTPTWLPDWINATTNNFTQPSDIARDCFKTIQQLSIVDTCQNQSAKDYDPARLQTPQVTTWEMCCSLYDEIDCYIQKASLFCPSSTAASLAAYSKKVADYYHYTVCQIDFKDWKKTCDAAVAKSKSAGDSSGTVSPTATPSNADNSNFTFHLPEPTGPEKACFTKLRTNPQGDLEQKCQNTSAVKWNPARRSVSESAILESCCAIYDTLDCIQRQSDTACNGTESNDLESYAHKSRIAFSQSICKQVPSGQATKLCKTAAAYGLIPSVALLAIMAALTMFGR